MSSADTLPSDFTEAEYARLLDLAATRWKFVDFSERDTPEPHLIWRHDVDYAPHRALAMARMEAARGLRCVYHVLPTGRYYNPIEPEIAAIFAEIARFGHDVGLHFDMDVFGPDAEPGIDRVLEAIEFQKRVVEQVSRRPVTSMSFHNFSLNVGRLVEAETIAGLFNASSTSIREAYFYVSDSNGIWRHRRLAEVLTGEARPRLHILTHPVWWTPEPLTPYQRFRRSVDGRAQAALYFYIDVMRRDGRFEAIGAQLGVPGALPPPQPAADPETRFAFGRNWSKFVRGVDDVAIAESRAGLAALLRRDSLKGLDVLDIGCGSGLSSLAALGLGARVRAFDYDPDSVEATRTLLTAKAPGGDWSVERGSVLDPAHMAGLDRFDVVYSWGVLHHTGAMWPAIDAAARAVKPGGLLALALYNDQGGASRRWLAIKRLYVASPAPVQTALVLAVGAFFELRTAAIKLARRTNPLPFGEWRRRKRGMSVWHDLVDWVGGYPFEVCKPEEAVEFLAARGFQLKSLKTVGGGHGCNEFLFRHGP